MIEGILGAAYSLAVGAFLGVCAVLCGMIAPSEQMRQKAKTVCARMTLPWLRREKKAGRHLRKAGRFFRFAADVLFLLFCSLVVCIFASAVNDGVVRIYMAVPFAAAFFLFAFAAHSPVYLFFSVLKVLLSDIFLTALWPLQVARKWVFARLSALSLRIAAFARRRYATYHAKRAYRRATLAHEKFKRQIIKDIVTWQNPSDVYIPQKSAKQ